MFYELRALIIDRLVRSSDYGYTKAQPERLTDAQLLGLLYSL